MSGTFTVSETIGMSSSQPLVGTIGDDTLIGNADANFFQASPGNDRIEGGEAEGEAQPENAGLDFPQDEMDYGHVRSGIRADLATGTVQHALGGIDTLVDIERLRGTHFADTIRGSEGEDWVSTHGGDDLIDMLGGDDWIYVGGNANTVDGGDGFDRVYFVHVDAPIEASLDTGRAVRLDTGGLTVLRNVEQLTGTSHGDLLTGDDGDRNAFSGRGGDDTIIGQGGYDFVWMGSAPGPVTVDLEAGTATGEGTDVLEGIEGIGGSEHSDLLQGSAADNVFSPDQNGNRPSDPDGPVGNDTIHGRGGIDTVDYGNAAGHVAILLELGFAIDAAEGRDVLTSIESARGGAFDDVILGDSGDNLLQGNGGADTIGGLQGNDTLSGGFGQDVLVTEGGVAAVRGTLAELDGDQVWGFAADDRIELDAPDPDGPFAGETFVAFRVADGGPVSVTWPEYLDPDNLETPPSSAVSTQLILTGTSGADYTLTLAGDYSGGAFLRTAAGQRDALVYREYMPDLAEGRALDAVDMAAGPDAAYLTGNNETDYRITLNRGLSEAGYGNALGVYEIAEDGQMSNLRILFTDARAANGPATVTDLSWGKQLGFFIVQDGASWAAALDEDDFLSFVDQRGGTRAVTEDGGHVRLAVNNRQTDLTVFHAGDAALNADGLQHAVAGSAADGAGLIVGFEDMTGGGDRDFQDVVFTVEAIDIA